MSQKYIHATFRNEYSTSRPPLASDDETKGFGEGSVYEFNNSGTITKYTCTDATAGAAVWSPAGSGSVSDLAGIPTSTATAATPVFFNASKNLVSMTASLWGTFWNTFAAKNTPVDADTIEFGNSASSFVGVKTTFLNLWNNYFKPYVLIETKKFVLELTFQNGGLIAKTYLKNATTLTFMYKSTSINTLEYSTNSGASYTSVSAGTISISISATTEVWFRITYVSSSATSEGIVYLEGTY